MSDDTLPRVAVMGAVAYDVIGKTDKVFEGNGPGLNCKVTAQKEFFGGCAGNIAGTIDGVVRSVRASGTGVSFTTLPR